MASYYYCYNFPLGAPIVHNDYIILKPAGDGKSPFLDGYLETFVEMSKKTDMKPTEVAFVIDLPDDTLDCKYGLTNANLSKLTSKDSLSQYTGTPHLVFVDEKTVIDAVNFEYTGIAFDVPYVEFNENSLKYATFKVKCYKTTDAWLDGVSFNSSPSYITARYLPVIDNTIYSTVTLKPNLPYKF